MASGERLAETPAPETTAAAAPIGTTELAAPILETPTPVVAARAFGATPQETPAPEIMADAAPVAADDSSALTSTAAAPEAAEIPQPLEAKVAEETVLVTPEAAIVVAVTPEAEIQEQKALVQSTPLDLAEEQESGGVVLPLRQLEIAMGALLAVLILATLWVARPRSGQPR